MPRNACLIDSELVAFHLGDLPERELDDLNAHIDGCKHCHHRSRQLESVTDPFLKSLRERRFDDVSEGGSLEDGQQGETAQGRYDDTRKLDEPRQSYDDEWPDHSDYEVLGILGQGGMGTVFKARQLGLNRTVALKQVRLPVALSRFRIEAEAVARLQHPNIVQVFSVEMQASRPFLALEYIDGPTLEDVISDEPQSIEDSAAIVRQIAVAVHYAHRQGIIHRDLKPPNILLQLDRVDLKEGATDDSTTGPNRSPNTSLANYRPKVTDFGVARFLAAESRQTLDGAVIGTPQYMAPEQAAADSLNVGPQTDIYSLGVILYEMLTGDVPFDGADTLDILTKVRTQEPVPLRRVRPELPRDLEAVCLKCLEKQPNRRYATANDLAADLDRFLSRRPVVARPVTSATRWWRWCRRNPVISGGLLSVFVSMAAALASTYAAYARNEDALGVERKLQEETSASLHAREQALVVERQLRNETRAALDAQTDRFMSDLLARQVKLTDAHKKYIRKTLETYERFATSGGQTQGDLASVASAWKRVGDLQHRLGRLSDADVSYSKSVKKFEQLVANDPASRDLRLKLARALSDFGQLLASLGRIDQALQVHRRSLAITKQLVSDFPDNEQLLAELSTTHEVMGRFLHQKRSPFAQVANEYQIAIKIQKNYLARHPRNDRFRFAHAHTLMGLGNLMLARKHHQDAENYLRRSAEILRSFTRKGLRSYLHEIALADALNSLGVLFGSTRRLKEAELIQDEVCTLRYALASSYPGVIGHRYGLALAYLNLGYTRIKRDRIHKARSVLNKAREIQEQVVRDSPGIPVHRDSLGRILLTLALVEGIEKRSKEALKFLDAAKEHVESAVRSDPENRNYVLVYERWVDNRADVLIELGDYASAVKHAEELIAARSAHDYPYYLVRAARIFARCALETGKRNPDGSKQSANQLKGYEDLAMKCLHDASRRGYPDMAAVGRHPYFASLRDRDEFRRLVRP